MDSSHTSAGQALQQRYLPENCPHQYVSLHLDTAADRCCKGHVCEKWQVDAGGAGDAHSSDHCQQERHCCSACAIAAVNTSLPVLSHYRR